MKKICFLFFIQFASAQTEDVFYHEPSNILVGVKKTKTISLGLNYNFGYKEIQAIYSINDTWSVFSMYNFNNTTFEKTTLFGDKITETNKNDGYSLGVAYRNFGNIGEYNTIEILSGYENQKALIALNFTNYRPEDKNYLFEQYYKLFLQFNLLQIDERHDSAYSLKMSYFKMLDNPLYKNQTTIFFAPSYSYNFKLLSDRNLVLATQIGLSIPTSKFEVSTIGSSFSTSQSNYVIAGILKFGIQYNFKIKKS